MIDTPRTDLAQFSGIPERGSGSRFVVEADFARQLERELHAVEERSIAAEDALFLSRGAHDVAEREIKGLRSMVAEFLGAVQEVLDDWANENFIRSDSRKRLERNMLLARRLCK